MRSIPSSGTRPGTGTHSSSACRLAPTGCARPYNADFAFVGRAPGKYALFVGGSVRGDRLAGLQEKSVKIEDIPQKIRAILSNYAAQRSPGETFTDWWGRTQTNGSAPHPDQFHVEFAARKAGSGCSVE
ncbi:MAG: hypothetical protein HC901_03875 [Bdellovibrionaceae bacterium]|nr:hypothetical protein [Pseudobdellovibrionaceae bacterium]